MLISTLGVDPSAADARKCILMSVLGIPMSKCAPWVCISRIRALFSGFLLQEYIVDAGSKIEESEIGYQGLGFRAFFFLIKPMARINGM